MLVYRDSRTRVQTATCVNELVALCERANLSADAALEAFLRAAEIECALADLAHPALANASALTEALAARYLADDDSCCLGLAYRLAEKALPRELSVKTPEGFAYYALDPARYAELAYTLSERCARAAVVGVRSIGTSLSAVVCSALQLRGTRATRMTVRPTGHPWDRRLDWDTAQRAWIEHERSAGAKFVVVDEGPGMSGSTFLSVAAALERCGVAAERILLFCSHQPDATRLIARDAARRWARYASWAAAPLTAAEGSVDFSAGAWRSHAYTDASQWPASWTQRERVKWWRPEAGVLEKFEGMPPYGRAPLARARVLAESGFAPALQSFAHGFARYTYVGVRAAGVEDLNQASLRELARYCAFRSRAFPASHADAGALEEMMRVNVAEAVGVEIGHRLPLELRAPVIVDGRMQPHEWRIDRHGRMYKTDGHGHGDDHLLPGPTDSCWDLAGAIVEWHMDEHQAADFVRTVEGLTGDRSLARRLPAFVIAYCAFRCGELAVAAHSCDNAEAARVARAERAYRQELARCLSAQGFASRQVETWLTQQESPPQNSSSRI